MPAGTIVATGAGVDVGVRLQPMSTNATSTSIAHRLTLLKDIVFTSLDLIQTAGACRFCPLLKRAGCFP